MSLHWFKKPENLLALSLAALILILHFVIIDQVHSQMFDEQHYVKAANRFLDGESMGNVEHPPLGKLLIALGIWAFGDEPFGWRFFPILFGAASIILFYLICQNLTARKWVPLLAVFLFAFDNNHFAQSHVAMLEEFVVTLMLAAFLLYLRGKYIGAGAMVALGTLVKLTGVLAIIPILLHWFFVRRGEWREGLKLIISAAVVFLALLPPLELLALHKFHWPWERLSEMYRLLSSITFSGSHHEAMSHPWEWVIKFWEPMWFWYKPAYQGCPNYTLGALIIPIMAFGTYRALRRSSNPLPRLLNRGGYPSPSGTSEPPLWGLPAVRGNSLCLFALGWFAATYLSLILSDLVSDRIMFKFYFYPSIGALYMILSLALSQIWHLSSNFRYGGAWAIRGLVIAFLLGHLAVFAIMSPYTSIVSR